jgi:DNA-binding MarR family transcriptional regulator
VNRADNAASEFAVLAALRLAGHCDAAGLAARLVIEPADASELLAACAARGHVEERGHGFALSDTGRSVVVAALDQERTAVDPVTARRVYAAFARHDRRLKELLTGWQLNGRPAGAVVQLAIFHDEFKPVLERAIDMAARLQPFPARFDTALRSAEAGDDRYLLHPAVDSYHTIWFELHEELLHLSGRTRTD